MTNYTDLKREVAYTLSKVLFGRTKHLSKKQEKDLGDLMRELDKTFKQNGVDWKLNE